MVEWKEHNSITSRDVAGILHDALGVVREMEARICALEDKVNQLVRERIRCDVAASRQAKEEAAEEEEAERQGNKEGQAMSESTIMQWFECEHLPTDLYAVADRIRNVAIAMDLDLGVESAEKSTGLRKLLEAKDCFVRARILCRKE